MEREPRLERAERAVGAGRAAREPGAERAVPAVGPPRLGRGHDERRARHRELRAPLEQHLAELRGAGILAHDELPPVAEVEEVLRGVEHGDAPRRRERLRERRRRPPGELDRGLELEVGELARARLELRADRGAVVDGAHEPGVPEERLHGVGGEDHGLADVREEIEPGRRSLERAEHVIAAVLVEVPVREPGPAELPQVAREERESPPA